MKPGRQVASVVLVLLIAAASVAGFLVWNLRPVLGLDLVGGVSVILTAPDGTESDVLERTVETIRDRVDAVGVAEPDITVQGDLNIQVQIPQLEEQGAEADQERLLELIGQTAQLEYREALETITPGTPEYEEAEVTERPRPRREVIYPEAEPAPDEEVDPPAEPTLFRLGEVLMTGDALSRATAQFVDPATVGDPSASGWLVSFELTGEGSRRFAQITQDLQGRQLAIALDGQVQSAPTVNEQITGGRGQITGDFTEQEAKDLALVLRTGALPVELERSQVETVSPTLGRESLRQGLWAGMVGLAVLAVFLLVYYRLLGLATWLYLAIWGILSLGVVALLGRWVGYSLTLAGVAGLVVSIGIAADSNIVFYERIKDELRAGKTVRTAVAPAFRRSWKTIVAANVVTIMAAVALYVLAIGSVRGFALTLGVATALDMVAMYFFMVPLTMIMARTRRIAELPVLGLGSLVTAPSADAAPAPARSR